MVKLFLTRHAWSTADGIRLAGRMPGVALTTAGVIQAERLAERLAPFDPTAVYSSPLDCAIATATPLALRLVMPIEIEPGLDEIDFGEWTGLSFDELERRAAWRLFNDDPSRIAIPGGESLQQVGWRAVHAIVGIAKSHPDGTVVVVSHEDVIRLLLARVLGMPLSTYRRLAIEPASCCELHVHPTGQISVSLDAFAVGDVPGPLSVEGPAHADGRHHPAQAH
jgi:broad specificity phosphatase PhoE